MKCFTFGPDSCVDHKSVDLLCDTLICLQGPAAKQKRKRAPLLWGDTAVGFRRSNLRATLPSRVSVTVAAASLRIVCVCVCVWGGGLAENQPW